jgi:predicted DNA-binding transcriptional regulator AlpA
MYCLSIHRKVCAAVEQNRRLRPVEKHLSVEELAEREGVPVGTVRQWNSRGTGPKYMRIGIYCRYRLKDVEEWEEDRTVEPPGSIRAKAG